MNIIQRFLLEMAPTNPDQVVIKNEFYPFGLTESDIYSYYMSEKGRILKEAAGRPIAFFLRIDNQIVVKRNHDGKQIVLTDKNYDDLITGRTNGIYVEHVSPTNYFVIDVDAATGVSYREVIKASDLAMQLLSDIGVKDWQRLFTSPRGLHLIGVLPKKYKMDLLRTKLIQLLSKQKEFLVNVKGRVPKTINYDLSPNYNRSIHMLRYSLTKEGLICDDISSPRSGTKIK